MHVHETWNGHFADARTRTVVAWFETKFRIKFRIIFQNILIVLLFLYVHVNMPHRFSSLSLLRRWLPDAPAVFAKASDCTLLVSLQPPYACGAAIIRTASGFLKSILQSDFVFFKFLIGTYTLVLGIISIHFGVGNSVVLNLVLVLEYRTAVDLLLNLVVLNLATSTTECMNDD
jgi:hypothetical protein